MVPIKITNLVKLHTILLLSEGPKHGYEIITSISEKTGRKVSSGQIYPFLKNLEEQKLVTSKERTERDKKVYLLTNAGKKFVSSTLDRFGSLIDIAVEPKLTKCAHCGCKVYQGGHKQKIKGKQYQFCCHHCAKSSLE